MEARSRWDRLFLIGPMGVGKSSIGRVLAQLLAFKFIDSDQAIEARTGADISWIFDVEGEQGFRKRERNMIAELTLLPNTVLATGGGAVLQESSRKLMDERGFVVYLTAPLEVLLERTSRDKRRPILQQKNRREILQKVVQEREPLYKEIADVEIVTTGTNIKLLAKRIAEYFHFNSLHPV